MTLLELIGKNNGIVPEQSIRSFLVSRYHGLIEKEKTMGEAKKR
jgi:hypothetical protein